MTTYSVPHTFIPGTKANASQVNENFSAVMSKIEDTKQSSANLDLSNLTAAGKKAIYDNASRSKLIGEIITSAIPLTDSGLHLLDGALLSGSGVYAGFVQYIAGLVANNPSLFVSETDWQQSVTSYGVCGKFVYDSTANTVRLPKITGFIEGTTDVTALGELIEAGLPNITGSYWASRLNCTSGSEEFSASGALYGTDVSSVHVPVLNSGTHTSKNISFDASRSNDIYGNSSTVQPQAIKVLYYIVVATTAKTDIEANIDSVATDLNNKLDKDLGNIDIPQSFVDSSIGWGIPDFSTGVTWSVTTGATFTAPYDCVVYHTEGFKKGASSQYYINGNSTYSIWSRGDGDIWTIRTAIYSLKKGDYITGFNASDANRLNQFVYYKFSGQSN